MDQMHFQIYLIKSISEYKQFLLRSVGVVDEPRAENLISLLLKDPVKVFTQLKSAKYIELMERIWNQWHSISSKQAKLFMEVTRLLDMLEPKMIQKKAVIVRKSFNTAFTV